MRTRCFVFFHGRCRGRHRQIATGCRSGRCRGHISFFFGHKHTQTFDFSDSLQILPFQCTRFFHQSLVLAGFLCTGCVASHTVDIDCNGHASNRTATMSHIVKHTQVSHATPCWKPLLNRGTDGPVASLCAGWSSPSSSSPCGGGSPTCWGWCTWLWDVRRRWSFSVFQERLPSTECHTLAGANVRRCDVN